MFFTGSELSKRISALEEAQEKTSNKIGEIEDAVSKKTSDYEEEAKASSESAYAYLETSENIKKSLEAKLEEVEPVFQEITSKKEIILNSHTEIETISADIKDKNSKVDKIYNDIDARNQLLLEKFQAVEEIVNSKASLDEKLQKLEEAFEKGNQTDSKISSLYQSITDRKKEIDDLYYKIVGYKEKDENGIDIEVKGLKGELEASYSDLKNNLETADKELRDLKESTTTNYQSFSKEKEEAFSLNLTSWNDKLSGIEKKITELLPRALTAGLSYAYSEKKESEIIDSGKHSSTFKWAITGLVLVSLIPFIFSLESMSKGESLETTILRIPRLALAILPLYIPILWVAYSANRKQNLSKRLIEEYSHKEVLSKTYEGLSKQISDINDKDISEDLRIKLLYNILEVNSENPGKLISDYNKSDHPLMDALDKSTKLSDAVTKLAKIPGFAKLTSALEKKARVILKEENKKAEAAIDSIDDTNK